MGFRITTNMMMNTYRYNLQNSTKKLSDARDMVMTKRTFGSYAEDPASATLAFRLRRDFLRANSYLSNTKDVYSKFNTAWQNLAGVVEELSDRTARVASIRGVSGTAGESRSALAVDLRETANSVIQALNQKLGDHFIFGGNDALNAPFSWSDNGKILYYRGVNVNAGRVKDPAVAPNWDKYTAEEFEKDAKTAKGIDDANAQLRRTRCRLDQELEKGKSDLDLDRVEELKAEIEKTKAGIEKLESELPKWWNDFTTNEDRRKAKVGLPENLPDGDLSSYEQVWKTYYEKLGEYQKDPENTPVPEAPGKPEWVKGLEDEDSAVRKSLILDGFGTLDEGAIKKLVKDLPGVGEDGLRDIDRAWIDFYQDQADVKKLRAMSGEEMYIDLGMGATESSPNNPVKGTYFNNALCGIDFLGYGMDEDGDPLNLAMLMRELADVFDTWDENADPQGYNPALAKDTAAGLSRDELTAKAERLMDKLKAAQDKTTEHWVELDAQSVYLTSSRSRLELQMDDLNMQILDVEQVDLADAITAFSWEQYCYNAALKIGNQLLSQSLIDYMS